MNKIKLIKIVFNNTIKQDEIEDLRKGVLQKLKNANVLFHNHLDGKFRYKYPLIQYKRINGKAAFICLDEGTEQIHDFLELNDWNIKIGDKDEEIKVKSINVNQFVIQAWDKYFDYTLHNWLALNSGNYYKYKNMINEKEKIFFLEKILRGNILTFAKGVDIRLDREVRVKINETKKTKLIKYKNIKLQAFDLKFSTNVFLPNYIGLGKGVSLGNGTVKEIKEELKAANQRKR